MQIAEMPHDEAERIAELLDYDVLDSYAEKEFDDLTQLAAEICKTPIALISLIDTDRQWFKSRVGLSAIETTRDIAFCAHAILHEQVFEIEDARLDKRFKDNPLVKNDPKIRFYAGAPLITPNGRAIGTLCTIDKIPKKLTAEQLSALQVLSQAVVSRFELKKKIKELHHRNKFKSEFLSYISHEIRTPLNAINAYSSLLYDELQPLSVPTSILKSLGYMKKSGQRLLHVVNSVLDINKIEAGKMTVQETTVECHAFFTHLYNIMKVKALEKGVHFHATLNANLPRYIRIDENKLDQVILNVLSNAIKFTDKGKDVLVTVNAKGEQLSVTVKDQGIGISKDNQSKLFQLYQRMDNATSYEGTGLGLSISKGLLEQMKGTLALTSELGRGTTVKIVVPLKPVHAPEHSPTAEPSNISPLINPEKLHILVVDDNEINREVAKSMFAALGVSVQVVSNGEESIDRVKSQHYDLIFMDLCMPGMSGEETTMDIRNRHSNLPIVALTADVLSNESELLSKGFNQVLHKPVEKADILKVINTYCT